MLVFELGDLCQNGVGLCVLGSTAGVGWAKALGARCRPLVSAPPGPGVGSITLRFPLVAFGGGEGMGMR